MDQSGGRDHGARSLYERFLSSRGFPTHNEIRTSFLLGKSGAGRGLGSIGINMRGERFNQFRMLLFMAKLIENHICYMMSVKDCDARLQSADYQ